LPKTLYFDCFSGASGDMILGALLDLGLPIDALRRALGSLAIEYGEVTAERVTRAGLTATKFRVIEKPGEPDGRGQHGHHHLKHIVAAIRRSALTAGSQDRAVQLFERLAEAEAAIHNTPIERVHLHEVGALDSIIDIVGAVYGFEWFGIDDIVSSPLNVGGGTVTCAHGVFPVPAPATARLLLNVPVYGNGASELVTPTGALLVTSYAREFGPLPAMRLARIGYGAGDRDPRETPNVLRLVLGERAAAAAAERIVTIECEIDDMNPQLFGPLMDRLSEAGALDVFYAAVQMKKNRPGTLVTVIAHPAKREAIAAVLFAHTTTIGVRYQEMLRDRLDREIQSIETPVGPIRFKVATRDGRVLNAAAEFDDCARIASERGVPIKDVQAIATRAWLDSRDEQRTKNEEPKTKNEEPKTKNQEPRTKKEA
jgi:pyridinium-3,5-bisthiocarboxylic acid mononucleotide nickel chelatase